MGRDGRITWRARVRLKDQEERSRTFRRKTDADKWAQGVENELRSGRQVPAARPRSP